MITIIAGSRKFGGRYLTDEQYEFLVTDAIARCGWTVTKVIEGEAQGIDRAARRWADKNNIPVEQVPAIWGDPQDPDWGAGYKRNVKMADEYGAEACIVIMDIDGTKGSTQMIKIAESRNLKVFVYKVKLKNPEK